MWCPVTGMKLQGTPPLRSPLPWRSFASARHLPLDSCYGNPLWGHSGVFTAFCLDLFDLPPVLQNLKPAQPLPLCGNPCPRRGLVGRASMGSMLEVFNPLPHSSKTPHHKSPQLDSKYSKQSSASTTCFGLCPTLQIGGPQQKVLRPVLAKTVGTVMLC